MSPFSRTSAVAALILAWTVAAPGQNATTIAMPLDNLDGSTSTLSEYLKTGPVYVTFWALWCSPCLQELRALEGISERNKNAAFTILAVNQDSPKSLAKVKAYVSSRGYAMPIVLDPNAQFLQAFNGRALPFSVLLEKNGKVLHTRTGYFPGDEKEIEREILEAAGNPKASE